MNKISKISFLSIVLISSTVWGTSICGQSEKVNWMTWEEAIVRSSQEQKMIFVDIYTDWCGWCKRMDKNTFQQPEIASYINKYYYAVKFDAEYKSSIELKNKVYNYVKNGRRGYHELAATITYGRLSFPTIVFLDKDMNVIQPISGYQDPKSFSMIMKYFAQGYYKTTPWDIYQVNYQKE